MHCSKINNIQEATGNQDVSVNFKQILPENLCFFSFSFYILKLLLYFS